MKLKWLKFYILGLIGLPIFLISFSSADYNGGYTFKIGDGSSESFYSSPFQSGYTFGAFRDGGFSSSFLGSYKNVIYPGGVNIAGYSNRFYNGFIFWDLNGRPYMYVSSDGNTRYSYHYNQGEITTYYICNELNSGDTSLNNCNEYNVGSSFDSILYNFLSGLTLEDYYFIGYDGYSSMNIDRNTFKFCFSSHSAGSSMCFMATTCVDSNDRYCTDSHFPGSFLFPLLDFSPGEDFTTLPSSWLYFSPYPSNSGDSSYDDSDVIVFDGLTGLNKNYYDLYKRIGFYSGLCYSDFALDNLVNSGTDFYDLFLTDLDDGEAYTGATIFDLKNQWFPSSSFISYFNNANAVYKTVFNNNDRLHIYDGKSKGQYRIFMKLNNADFIDTYTLSPIDVNTFCSFVINGYDPNGIFTGDTSVSAGNIKQNIDLTTNVYLSGSDVDFSGATDLFGIFNNMYSRFKGAFPVDERLSSHSVGILPSYIILGFFLFVLLYGLKR